ncbi:MAG TPA: MMPL family transporter [Verrucomicrobiae bacterium]|nr:MMPL family transporter [Verrucomicrobiae bacterium]
MKELNGPFSRAFLKATEPFVFGKRPWTLGFLIIVTLFMGWQAAQLRPDAGFEKQLPLQHEYIKVFKKYQQDFGGANLVLTAIVQKEGTIYNPGFMETLRKATDEVFFLPGVDRSRVSSLYTPDVRFIEVVEGGFSGGNVIPAEFKPTPEMLEQVRSNVNKSTVIGRLVANDHTGAMVFAELLEFDPLTGEKLDYVKAANLLEDLRGRFMNPEMYEYRVKADHPPFKAGDVAVRGFREIGRLSGETFDVTFVDGEGIGGVTRIKGNELEVSTVKNPDYNPDVTVHLIGFAKVVGDVSAAVAEVVGFFGLTLALTLLLLWYYTGRLRIAVLPLACALLAVFWELGMLHLFGFGLDPFAILVPFLVLAIGVSHGVQITNFWLYEMADHGRNSFDASRATFRRLVIPGITALITNVVGFGTILLIPIDVIQEMAWNAIFGCCAIVMTKKVLLPILLSYVKVPDLAGFREHQKRRDRFFDRAWESLAALTDRRNATMVLGAAAVVFAWSAWMYGDLKIGELHKGVPQLRPDSRYNLDSAMVGEKFAIGVDQLKVIAETSPQACVEYAVMETITQFAWRMTNTPGVQKVISLPQVGSIVSRGYNEGNPKWKVLPRNRNSISQAITPFDTSTGLLSYDCSAMPVLIFTRDHKAETVEGIIEAIRQFKSELPADSKVNFALASGNVGVIAASNEVIKAKELPILLWVYAAIGLCVWLSFRTLASMVCVLVPLIVVSWLAYAVMVLIDIGLTVATLPVAAFAAGIGVDYGIYIYSVLEEQIEKGLSLREAYKQTLHQTGKAVVFTGLTLGAAVCTWLMSELQFQVDMGLLLTLMFIANAIGAVVLLPAFASFLVKPHADK